LGSAIGIVSPTIDKCLQMLAILHLRFVFTPQVPLPLGLCGVELGKVANMHINKELSGVRLQLPLIIIKTTRVLMDNVRRYCIKKGAIVGSKQG
jgi:hypothetical protein